jgi:hypothetical protein
VSVLSCQGEAFKDELKSAGQIASPYSATRELLDNVASF